VHRNQVAFDASNAATMSWHLRTIKAKCKTCTRFFPCSHSKKDAVLVGLPKKLCEMQVRERSIVDMVYGKLTYGEIWLGRPHSSKLTSVTSVVSQK
jgi:hypothetical protein